MSKYCVPTVFATKACASGLAGLKPSNFINPNQKNIRKIENLATGIKVLLKNAMSFKSIAVTFCFAIARLYQETVQVVLTR